MGHHNFPHPHAPHAIMVFPWTWTPPFQAPICCLIPAGLPWASLTSSIARPCLICPPGPVRCGPVSPSPLSHLLFLGYRHKNFGQVVCSCYPARSSSTPLQLDPSQLCTFSLNTVSSEIFSYSPIEAFTLFLILMLLFHSLWWAHLVPLHTIFTTLWVISLSSSLPIAIWILLCSCVFICCLLLSSECMFHESLPSYSPPGP